MLKIETELEVALLYPILFGTGSFLKFLPSIATLLTCLLLTFSSSCLCIGACMPVGGYIAGKPDHVPDRLYSGIYALKFSCECAEKHAMGVASFKPPNRR
jgi:hypothetical protein